MSNEYKSQFDEISPITGNLCVMVERSEDGGWNKLCWESGYTSFHTFSTESGNLETYEQQLPAVAVSHKRVDEDGYAWYPSYMPTPGAALFCIGTTTEFEWMVAPMDTELGLDVSRGVKFPAKQFPSAFDYLMSLNNTNEDE